MDAFGWHLILRAIGQEISPLQSIRIWISSSFVRYLPGGIWPYVSRVSLSKDVGIDIYASSLSLYIETLLIIASSLAVGLPSVLNSTSIHINPYVIPAFIILFLLLIHPKFVQLIRFIPGKIGEMAASMVLPDIKKLIFLYLYYVIFWFFIGAAFVCFINAFYLLSLDQWFYAASVLSFSFCVGFIIIFVPGGIGVRESIIYILLVQIIPSQQATLIAIGSRIWIMAAELFSLLIVWIVPQKRDR